MTGNDRTMPLDSRAVMLSAQVCQSCGGGHAAVGVLSDEPAYRDRLLFQCPACREMSAGIVAAVEVPAGSDLGASVLAMEEIGDEMGRLRAVPDRRA